MAIEDHSNYQGGKKRKRGRTGINKHEAFGGDNLVKNPGGQSEETFTTQRSSKHQKVSVPQTSFLRKQVDPETAKYFAEIANVVEGSEIDFEERFVICGNALEEARGKEVEVATDYIISHTLQTLLEGCSVEQLCGFLTNSAKDFSHIATDRSGSHVAETALKSLAVHLQDIGTHSLIEGTVSAICKTALKLLAGQSQLLLHIIPILLGCSSENATEGNLIEMTGVQDLLSLMEETAFSHLMEVILEVAPETLYNELFFKIFRNSLFSLSSHQCGNFVVQALISHARTQDQMEIIWEELGAKFKDLLEMGRSGVVASIIAACQRLHCNENKCCQALAASVHGANESPTYVVPKILFLDNYFFSEDKSHWNWPNDAKMHVVGSLMLQSIFRLPSDFIQIYVTSMTSLEDRHILQTSKDPSGSRVIEAFLSSNASAKQKRRLVLKLREHFGEISVHPSGSFTIEKYFNASSLSLREMIVSELLAVQTELSKTKQGPYLLKKLDVEGFAKRPDQWKLRQTSKQSAYKEFYAAFGPSETKASKKKSFLAGPYCKSQPEKLKDVRKEIETCLSRVAPTSGSQFLSQQPSKTWSGPKRPQERSLCIDATNGNNMKFKKEKTHNRK